MILISFSIMSYHAYLSSCTYWQGNKWSSQVTEITSQTAQLPLITICNFNRMNRTRAKQKWDLTDDLITYLNKQFATDHAFPVEYNETISKTYKEWRRQHGDILLAELLMDLGHTCEQSLVHGALHNKFVNCSTVAYQLDSEFGKCFTINAHGELGSTSTAGTTSSLHLLLHAGSQHYSTRIEEALLDQGLVIKVSYDDQPSSWISLTPGFHTWIGMKTKVC